MAELGGLFIELIYIAEPEPCAILSRMGPIA